MVVVDRSRGTGGHEPDRLELSESSETVPRLVTAPKSAVLMQRRPLQTQLGSPQKIAHDDAVERANEEQIEPAQAIVAMDDGGENQFLATVRQSLSKQDRALEIQMDVVFANDTARKSG